MSGTPQPVRLSDLPEDLLVYITASLRGCDILSLSETCKALHRVVQQPEFWTHLICERFGKVIAALRKE